jgi:hypothetical protein
MNKLTVTCTAWRPLRRNTLTGFATVEIPEMRLIIHDIAIHQKGEARWAQLPSKPWVRDGALVLDEMGKPTYSPMLEFTDRPTREAFSRRAVEAVLRFDPHALKLAEGVA